MLWKMKKKCFPTKMDATKLDTNQITTENPQEKTSGNNKFISVPIRKDRKDSENDEPLDLKITSRMKMFSHLKDGDLSSSLGINIENETLLAFQKIQDQLQTLAEQAKPQIKKISPTGDFS